MCVSPPQKCDRDESGQVAVESLVEYIHKMQSGQQDTSEEVYDSLGEVSCMHIVHVYRIAGNVCVELKFVLCCFEQDLQRLNTQMYIYAQCTTLFSMDLVPSCFTA